MKSGNWINKKINIIQGDTTEIAFKVIHSGLLANQNILHVNLVCFVDENYEIYRSLNE
ncbi:hypothetical protein [Xenorhabdus sp. PB62.4]|uniref:hypothetical protein n=1 Tax=Xenorhabdus sp. PB62.4 TaxID=1851573 RepID=UPI0016570019|nr:hypothetical protein [Xenorhabdus sp. PB62.4]MBC8953982.1 RNase III inhibitor [Xenorhabdus sp. PB62.4]